jgi:hypothetical protein
MLNDTQVQQAKARDKHCKFADQGGLYLYVSPTGAKSWRYDYYLHGGRETVTLGTYPEFSLAEARELHTEARRKVARGESPAKAKQAEKRVAKEAARAAREAEAREKARERIPATPVAAFSDKKITELTAGEGIFLANALAGVFADAFADRVISRWFERGGAGAPGDKGGGEMGAGTTSD